MAKLLINCTHGREDAERATLSFVVGNVAAQPTRTWSFY